ncbi:ATP-binding protein [Clostridium sp. OF09-36]|nr:ATP-binding protein [Clostridium sp. OF09-36]
MTEISVEDNGIGISEEFQQHIFEAFNRQIIANFV